MAKANKIKFKIMALSANDKATDWVMKLKSPFGIDKSKKEYMVGVEIDKEYFKEKIRGHQSKIDDIKAKPDMFDDYKKSIKSLEANIEGVKDREAELTLLQIAEFCVTTSQVDYKKAMFTLEIPEEVVASIIELRHDVKAFFVKMK